MTHPLDDTTGLFLVLDNARDESSLWPHFVDVPPGWTVAFGAAGAEECRAFIAARPPAAAGMPQAFATA
ncbi:MbtH family protein [Acidovorax sp. NCPPB 4044]|uniref:MbtH family protein n=1 Tax=Acidovorax sp. NCPPB 4044 TaxID=2940490 RepID=UPI002304B30E|nr:MbtH family protein [Acidovorax sp. NCPPB 4044]MDA8523485.1 MbtH family protein [Acidovorax sp. NCPPB 4044]